MDPTVVLDLFALLDTVPSRDEIFVFRIGGCKVTGQKITVIQLPERVCQVRGCSVTTVCQYDLEKRTIVVEFGGLGYGHAVQVYATLTEELV